MSEKNQKNPEITKIKDFVKDGRIDDAVKIIALYLGDSTQEDYIERLEDIIEMLLLLHGGQTVLRFLIEQLVIDIPSLLENLSKRDSILRYSFLLLLKTMCEKECSIFLPYSEDLLSSEDPNVREAVLQLIIFMAGGENKIEDESLIGKIADTLTEEKEFVVEKAVQALKVIGRNNPSLVTKIITLKVKENPENEELKSVVDIVLKSIVTVEKIDELVEESEKREITDKELIEKEEAEIIDKELELKKKEIEIKKKKLELQEKEKEIEKKIIQEKEKTLKLKEEIIEQESKEQSDIETDEIPKKVKKQLKKEESEILDKEILLKKKDLEIKKKKLELEFKEREIEELAIIEKEKTLKLKEELIEKESELSQVEIELHQKKIEEKERKILEGELERAEDKIKDLEKEAEDDEG
ncbi:MAG: hypothetical protein CEE42_10400 [Promethearchaeota archaeon Loki_b31]|nr:MAG: hypothetical protein CEE42_10400 [Candidatus Lokiarchaeota archaeon Loki_b31]